MTKRYEPQRIEERWQKRWREEGTFRAPNRPDRPKRYVLEMFPYPSGRIHMGHVRCYAIGDVIARYGRMRGYDVLHPMGWDAFGLPAENAAIQHGVPPDRWTRDNVETMRRQLRRLGLSYDWERELATCDPEYYRWEQVVFLRMLERGLAYRRKATANWCPSCETVLANEQVEEGACWRCGSIVEERELDQWFLRITDYAEELLESLDRLDGWPERVRTMQRNWIGKSVGAEIRFPLEEPRLDGDDSITVFTTRPDTLYGATFMSLAVEHPLVRRLADATGRTEDVDAFVRRVRMQSREERTGGKEGVFLGAYCRNPLSGRRMPIYVANFVLMEYGTGAVMAVPTHDQRDFEFARAYDLPLVVVIEPEGESLDRETMTEAWEGPGRMVRSGPFDGLSSEEGKTAVAEHLEREGWGGPTVQYRLRDWCISRQRYWGTPIPVVYCDRCGVVSVPENELPVLLPEDVPFTGEGGSPLARSKEFLQAKCGQCGGSARRETDTMDTFVDSSWYFARFASPDETRQPLDPDRVDRWLPVDQYIGGIEHAVLHLIYARFYTKVLRDLGFLSVDEPFRNLLTQGMVSKETLRCPEHGWLYPEEVEDGTCARCQRPAVIGRVEAMSKSKRNIVDPEDLVARYGADAVRLFSLFAAPPERDLEWSDQGLEGAWRFLGRLWRLALQSRDGVRGASAARTEPAESALELRRKLHRTIHKVTEDVGARFHFNTAIAAVMEFVNALGSFVDQGGPDEPGGQEVLTESLRAVLQMLHPIVPHLTAELWETLGFGETMAHEAWPEVDPSALEEETVLVVVQVNGRVRGRVTLPKGASEDQVVNRALQDDGVRRNLDGREIRKRIYVPDRLLNLVVG